MSKVLELRRQRAELNDQIQQLAQKENEGGQLSKEELGQFEQLSSEFKSLSQQISRLELAESAAAATAKPIEKVSQSAAVHVKSESVEQYQGSTAARMVMSIAAGKGDIDKAVDFAAGNIGDESVAMALETGASSGGALIPNNVANEVIELLRPKTIVRGLGAQSIPLVNGNMSLPRMSGGATSGYVGEGSDVLATESSLDDVKLSAKTLITLVPMSNQLIGRAGRQVENLVLNDMLNAMAQREDKAFLRDDGSSNTPIGFKKCATDAGQIVAWSGDADLVTIDAYLDSMVLKLMESDSIMVMPGWGLSPRSFMKLSGLRDGNGNKVYPEMAQGQLKGWPIKHTTTIPTNLGAGSNESEIYFADWNDVVIGESDDMTIDFSKEATYKDSGGNLVSAFARNQSVIRVVNNHDIGFRHDEGLVLGSKITW